MVTMARPVDKGLQDPSTSSGVPGLGIPAEDPLCGFPAAVVITDDLEATYTTCKRQRIAMAPRTQTLYRPRAP